MSTTRTAVSPARACDNSRSMSASSCSRGNRGRGRGRSARADPGAPPGRTAARPSPGTRRTRRRPGSGRHRRPGSRPRDSAHQLAVQDNRPVGGVGRARVRRWIGSAHGRDVNCRSPSGRPGARAAAGRKSSASPLGELAWYSVVRGVGLTTPGCTRRSTRSSSCSTRTCRSARRPARTAGGAPDPASRRPRLRGFPPVTTGCRHEANMSIPSLTAYVGRSSPSTAFASGRRCVSGDERDGHAEDARDQRVQPRLADRLAVQEQVLHLLAEQRVVEHAALGARARVVTHEHRARR